jgi:hypothetical protein
MCKVACPLSSQRAALTGAPYELGTQSIQQRRVEVTDGIDETDCDWQWCGSGDIRQRADLVGDAGAANQGEVAGIRPVQAKPGPCTELLGAGQMNDLLGFRFIQQPRIPVRSLVEQFPPSSPCRSLMAQDS